jgi:prepilin-type N-terminal cleavage/methylation domain-containing protein
MTSRAGVTLVELIIVLGILGLLAGVTALALGSAHPIRAVTATDATIASTRRAAIDAGRPVTVAIQGDSAPRDLTAFPDGSVIADPGLHVDRVTGAPVTP